MNAIIISGPSQTVAKWLDDTKPATSEILAQDTTRTRVSVTFDTLPRRAAAVSAAIASGLFVDGAGLGLRPLPSSDSARDLVTGVEGAAPRVVGHMLGRAALMGTGMLIAGVPLRTTVRAALAGTVAIEAFALLWFAAQKK